jgi:hypothetical protein
MRLPLLTALVLGAVALQPQDQDKGRRAPEVGKPAPLVRLNDDEGKAAALGGAAEHWTVIAFYPKALTPG